MDIAHIRARFEDIRRAAAEGDFEAAHSKEDDLHQDVLRAIQGGHEFPAVLAFEALATTIELDFPRHCA